MRTPGWLRGRFGVAILATAAIVAVGAGWIYLRNAESWKLP